MRLYLDSRDLINLCARAQPVTFDELGRTLEARDAQLVYSWSNIMETMTQGDIAESRRRLEILDTLPKTYILALPPLIRSEFQAALRACFNDDLERALIDPWTGTWLQCMRMPGHRMPHDLYVNYTMVDQVLEIQFNNPGLVANTADAYNYFMTEIASDRIHEPRVRRSWDWFCAGIRRVTNNMGIAFRQSAFDRFTHWLHDNGGACPGWRLFSQSCSEFCNNVHDQGGPGHANDFSHITAAPYVDAITLDRAMAHYCEQAATRLRGRYPNNYEVSIFPNLEAWLNE
jgi:hypothetical protein